MKLSKELEQYILQTAAQNPHTVVVLNCGAAVDMTNWIDEVEAVLWAGYAGEQGQLAVADILTGKVNPSGKLTETFPIDDDAAPSAHTYIDQMKLRYDDGLLVGYRWYDMEERDGYSSVRFPFGYGLSYTQFAYSDLTLKRKGEEVEVSFDVKNIGSVAGAEVAQIYVREAHSCVFRPFKELKGFKKVYLAAGEKKRVTLSLDKRAFAFYSTALDRWTVNGGDYEIIVGASAEDIRLTASVKLD
jgi:beta-glucosidase